MKNILLWFWVFFTRNVHETKYLKEGTVEMAMYLHEISHLRWAPTWRTLNLHECMTSATNRELTILLVIFWVVTPNCLHRWPRDRNETNQKVKKYSHRGVHRRSFLVNLFRISHTILYYSICNVILSLSSTKVKDLVLSFVLRTLNLSSPSSHNRQVYLWWNQPGLSGTILLF